MLTNETVKDIFRGDIIGKEIIFFESVTSTNDIAFETAGKRKDPEGIVIIADAQTKGKGRLGRTWISPAGKNLYFSIIFTPPFSPKDAPFFTLSASVAVAKAIITYTGLEAMIKWPNDILLNDKKTGGILTEMRSSGDGIIVLVLGIGIDVNMSLTDFPEDIRSLATSPMAEKGMHIDRSGLLREVLAEIEKTYKNVLNGNKRALINAWLGLNCTIGKNVQVLTQHGIVSGHAEGIADTGELILRLPSGKTEILNAGEVTIVKK